ncbi:MAG: Ldh family oxidoreductase, partial [Candidatus Bathyarchaeia archaeon]
MKKIVYTILEAAGASIEDAKLVARMLVEANLCGVDSHGVIRIPEYVDRIFGKPGYGVVSRLE